MPTSENPGASVPGEYSVDDEDQLQPEDTLLDRGEDDVLDEGYSPPERPLAMEPHDSSSRVSKKRSRIPRPTGRRKTVRIIRPEKTKSETSDPVGS